MLSANSCIYAEQGRHINSNYFIDMKNTNGPILLPKSK